MQALHNQKLGERGGTIQQPSLSATSRLTLAF